MKARIRFSLILFLVLILGSCQSIQPMAEPTVPAPFRIFLSPSASYWQSAISDCTRDLPQLSVLVEQEPQDLVQSGPQDWIIQSGEPVGQIAYPLGEDDIVVISNPSNPIDQIDPVQLKGIYTGFISTWGELNPAISDEWKNQKIQAIHYLSQEPMVDLFLETTLEGEVLSPRIWLAPGSAEVVQEVVENPNALSWVPSRWVTSTVKVLSRNLIAHIPLTLSMQQEPDEFQKILIGCLQSKAD